MPCASSKVSASPFSFNDSRAVLASRSASAGRPDRSSANALGQVTAVHRGPLDVVVRPTKLEDVTVPFRRGHREVCRVRRHDRVPAFDDLCPRRVPQLGAIVDITVPSKTVLIPGVLGSGTRNEENTKRSGNASVKNPEHLALGIAMKRLVRGPWFAALCAAMAAACENIH
jgi:hypothetical protein